MSYHMVKIEEQNRHEGDKSFYSVTAAWSKWDVKRTKPSEAYTQSSEDHKVLHWSSNDSVVPSDIMEQTDWPFQAEMDAARDVQTAAFLGRYREAQANRSDEQIAEERFEARAAMGPGVDMVNVFTGERYRT